MNPLLAVVMVTIAALLSGCTASRVKELRLIDTSNSSRWEGMILWASDSLKVYADAETGYVRGAYTGPPTAWGPECSYWDSDEDGVIDRRAKRWTYFVERQRTTVNIPSFKISKEVGPTVKQLNRFPEF